MIDKGFDISNYKKIRKNLGGNEAFENLLKTAKENDMHIMVDMVLNHISHEHEWFQRAVQGSSRYRDYFYHSKDKPQFLKRYKNKEGVWAKYLVNGKEMDIYIVFPEQAGEIPHWYQAEDGYWYYHTFYPHQLDVNWNNPEVFLEFVEIIAYWASKGLSFRLDAIPYIGKSFEKNLWIDEDKTHSFIEALKRIMEKVNPNSIFLVESCVDLEDIKIYFGDNESESELAYNFPLMQSVWTALLTGEIEGIWKNLEVANSKIPDWASWVNFLRNHDEMTLENQNGSELYEQLISKGLPFREGFGVSGRTYDFLDKDSKRVLMAYSLLASLPGIPAVIYGDEIGKENDYQYMITQLEEKRKQGISEVREDTRDINRGQITESEADSEKAKDLYNAFSKLFKIRAKYAKFFRQMPKRLDAPEGIFKAKYKNGGETLVVIVNLTDEKKNVEVDTNKEVIYSTHDRDSTIPQKLEPYETIWVR
jgi:maltose alpha-D-glucosyltransferase/alpha-amylase